MKFVVCCLNIAPHKMKNASCKVMLLFQTNYKTVAFYSVK